MPLDLTYVGCEGVLVRSRSGSVLIDALFSDEAEPFGMPGKDALDALRRARPPFDRVDAVLATHHHPDHFDPGAVGAYLDANRSATFVSTVQATSELLAATGGAFAERIRALDAVEGRSGHVDVGAVRIEGFGLSHGKVHYADVQHLGLLVTIDGRRILHLGDGIIDERSLRAAGVVDDTIDVGVLPFWFLTYPFGKRLVSRGLRPRAMFAVHIRVSEREQVVREIGAHAVALMEPLASYTVGDDGTVIRKE